VHSPLPLSLDLHETEYLRNTDYCNESSVGTALRETGLARSEFFITTKYLSGVVQEEVRNSLDKVRSTDYASVNAMFLKLFMWKAGTQTSRPIPHPLSQPLKRYSKDMEGI